MGLEGLSRLWLLPFLLCHELTTENVTGRYWKVYFYTNVLFESESCVCACMCVKGRKRDH